MLTDRAEGLMRLSRVIKYLIIGCSLPAVISLPVESAAVHDSRIAPLAAMFAFMTLVALGPSWSAWRKLWFRRPMRSAVRTTIIELVLVGGCLATTSMFVSGGAQIAALSPVRLSLAVTLLLALNRFLPQLLAKIVFGAGSRQQILMLGSETAVAAVQQELAGTGLLGLDIVARNDLWEPWQGVRLFDPNRTPSTENILSQIDDRVLDQSSSKAVDQVWYVEDSQDTDDPVLRADLQSRCAAYGVPLSVYKASSPVSPVQLLSGSETVLSSPQTIPAPLHNPVNQALKRCLDVAVALPVVLFVLPPLCTLVHLLHRRESPGSLFYRQERCGRNGARFQILKFRTMHQPSEGQPEIADNSTERIFGWGGILRDSRLDEIPQFVNVLTGQMSVVGPRAHHVQDRDKFSSVVPHYPMRLQIKPGITGLAQYREYRGSFHRSSIADRVDCDLRYIAHWTLEWDLILMVKTARLISNALWRVAVNRLLPRPTSQTAKIEQPLTAPLPHERQAA